MRFTLAALALASVPGFAAPAAAQNAAPAGEVPAAAGAPASLSFSLDRTGPPLTQYTLRVLADGTGTYTGQTGATPVPSPGAGAAEARPLHIAPALVHKLFLAVPTVEGGRCETHSKHLANTGKKTLSYVSDGRTAVCTYNYSDDDRVNDATATFQGLAETLQFGDRLRTKLRFDRLGLDGELEGLQTALTDGRALEVGNIGSVLHSIMEDDRVMDRVRRRAQGMLGNAVPAQVEAAPSSSAR